MLNNFYTSVIQSDPRFHSVDDIRDMSLLEPMTRAAVLGIIADSAAQGIQLFVTETYRSKERQEMLWRIGQTKLKVVGVHHFGLAADFAKMVDGKASWAGDWTFIIALAAKHGLISGVNWGLPKVKHDFIDSDHVQRCSIYQQAALFAGTWYPDDDYDPASYTVIRNRI